MTAPEKIWANVTVTGDFKPLAGEWNYKDVGNSDDTEYTRSDMIPNAAYVAGLEAAAKRALEEAVADDMDTWFEGLRAALSARPDAADTYIKRVSLADLEGYGSTTQPADTRVVTVAQLDRWLGCLVSLEIKDEILALTGEKK